MESDHTKGHRQRMRNRLLTKGADTLTELEVLEMLLFAARPRSDTKPLAKSLMRQFGSLAAVLRAPEPVLRTQKGVGDSVVATLKIVEVAGLNLVHSDVKDRTVLTSWGAVQHYCVNRLAHEPIEYLIMLCLDNRNRLIAEGTLAKGTINQALVCVREVVKSALKHHAQAVILVHNHPSGETEPSRTDLEMTEKLKQGLEAVTIKLHDHLIVAGTHCVSFKSLGYL